MSQPILNVRIAPSGQGIAVEAFGPDGVTPAPIAGFAGLDESQSLTFSGPPSAQSFALTYNGATTGPIPFLRVPPTVATTFHVALPAPGAYDVQVNTPIARSSAINQWAVYDGVVPAGPPASFDVAAAPPAGSPVDPSGVTFRSLGRHTFATTSAAIEGTAAIGVTRYTSAVRLVPAAGGPAIIQVITDPALTYQDSDRPYFQPSGPPATPYTDLPGYYGAGYYPGETRPGAYPTPQPSSWHADPAAVAAALSALPGFSGGVTASSPFFIATRPDGDPTSRAPQVIALTFGGPKAATAIGLPTPSDPAVVAAVTHPGGQPIRYRINGGPAAPLPPGAITFNGAAPQSYFYVPFPQSDIYPGTVGGAYVATADGYTFGRSGGSLSGVGAGNAAYTGASTYLHYGLGGSTLSWPFQGLPPATYALEVTWPAIDPAKLAASYPFLGPSPAATIQVLDKSGAVLHSESANQAAAPSGITDPARPGVVWHPLGSFAVAAAENRLTVNLVNPDGKGLTIADAVRLTRTSPDVSVKVGPADVVTLDAPAGAILTAAGPSPAIVATVVPHAGASFAPDPSLVKPAMPVGWNAGFEDTYGANLGHANLLHRITVPDGPPGFAFSNTLQADAAGNPTLLSSAKATTAVVALSDDGESAGPGAPVLPNDPAGVWSVWYDGPIAPTLGDHYGTPYPATGTPIAGQATGNRAYFHGVADPRATCPEVSITLHGDAPAADGTYPCSTRVRAIYPPDPATGKAWAGPPTWHPTFSSRLGIGPIRVLDMTGAAGSNIATFADTGQPGEIDYNHARLSSAPIARIEADPAPDGFFNPLVGAIVRVTTAAPHGFNDMDGITLTPGPSGTMGLPAYTMNGQPYAGYGPFDNAYVIAHVTGPTTFSFTTNFNRPLTPGVGGFAMTNALTPAGATAVRAVKPGTPYADIVALAVEAKAPLWVPIPSNANDDLIARIAALCLAIPKGTPVRVEYSNETWNSGAPERAKFEIWSYSMGLSTAAYDYAPSYLAKMKHCHDIVAGAFKAAGREADVVRVCGSQMGDPGITTTLARYAVAHRIPIDEIAIAPYLDGAPLDALFGGIPPALMDRFNTYTVPQNLDLLELMLEYGQMRDTFQIHRGIIDAAGLKRADGSPVRATAYEAGFQSVIPGDPTGYVATTATNSTLRSVAVLRDPRMYRASRRALELAQLGGCSLWVEYRFGDRLQGDTWDKVIGTYQGYGTGDPAKDTANVSPFANKARVVSQVAGAYRDWSVAASSTTRPKTSIPIPISFFFQPYGGI